MKTKLFQFGLVLSSAVGFYACNSSTGTAITKGTPPSDLSFSQDTIVFALGVPDSGVGADVTGDVTSFSIVPALPLGLTFDTAEGTIMGTATVTSPVTQYLVTAKNSYGSTMDSVHIAVSILDTTLSGLVQNIFNNNCADCHEPGGSGYAATGAANGGLDLSTGHAFASLVNQPTYEDTAQAPFVRVSSGYADSSYLYQKIFSANPKFGLRMPYDGPPYLSTEEIAIIKAWINKGTPQ